MSARVVTSWHGFCDSCPDGSEFGLPKNEAEAWVDEHNRLNHESQDSQ